MLLAPSRVDGCLLGAAGLRSCRPLEKRQLVCVHQVVAAAHQPVEFAKFRLAASLLQALHLRVQPADLRHALGNQLLAPRKILLALHLVHPGLQLLVFFLQPSAGRVVLQGVHQLAGLFGLHAAGCLANGLLPAQLLLRVQRGKVILRRLNGLAGHGVGQVAEPLCKHPVGPNYLACASAFCRREIAQW